MEFDYGWRGKKVRNADGRTGVIRSEDGFGPVLTLNIKVDDGSSAKVVLRSGSRDGGEAGWEYWCANFDGGARWIAIGEFN